MQMQPNRVTAPVPGAADKAAPGIHVHASPGRGQDEAPAPATRTAHLDRVTAPGRGRSQTPAGGALDADGAPLAGQAGRTFTIALPAGLKLLSLNDRLHYGERYRRTQELKRAACVLALSQKIPRLERVSVVVEYQPRDKRERDPDNISPSGKAALDGIVAAKILTDDSKTYVTGVRCTIGEPYLGGRLVLHLTEVAATGGEAA